MVTMLFTLTNHVGTSNRKTYLCSTMHNGLQVHDLCLFYFNNGIIMEIIYTTTRH